MPACIGFYRRKTPTPLLCCLQLKAAGLNALNISLDTLQPQRFEALTRRGGHARVVAAIREALDLGFDPVKVGFWAGASQPAA